MATLIAIPMIGILAILQAGLISRLPMLHGTADLILLMIIAWALQKRVETAWQWCIIGGLVVNIISAVPFGMPLLGYSLTTAVALALRRHIWQVPILAMFLVAFLGTLITQGITLLSLRIGGVPIPIPEALNLVILPSVLLNLLFAIPMYFLAGELAGWLYPEEIKI
jgi:rod shape-determining protein MreD